MLKKKDTTCNNANIQTDDNGYIRFNGHNYKKGYDLLKSMQMTTGAPIGKNFAQSIGYSIDINREWYWSYTIDGMLYPTESIVNRLLGSKSVNKNLYWKASGMVETARTKGHTVERFKVDRKQWVMNLWEYMKRLAIGDEQFPLVSDTWL